MEHSRPGRQSSASIKLKNNTVFLYIGTFFFIVGCLSVGILMVMFFLNTLENIY